jgi:hypothetical protein
VTTPETGGGSTDRSTPTETPDRGDSPETAEDPSNRTSRGNLDIPASAMPSQNAEVDTRVNKEPQSREKQAEWDRRLGHVLEH